MLNKQDTGLIMVDVQGKLASLVSDSERMISNCAKLLSGALTLELPIVWLEQNPEKLGRTVEKLSGLLVGQTPITKFTFDACSEPSFIEHIQAADKKAWLICGIEAHICVYQTAMSLKKLGHEVHLVVDCISSREAGNKALAIEKMSSAGIKRTSLEMCLYELVKDCRAPEFKTILGLVKSSFGTKILR
ncbi:MAG: isochorismatase family protein [Vibrio sp.]|uniref:isochorismatase family protein n=1 Tax=Vibrio sp. TaxID=678 RepID=UPI003A83CF0C